MIEAMDAIGWIEQPDAPDLQPVRCSRLLAAWARSEAKGLRQYCHECEPQDVDFDA
jgi:hypothetical protein